MKELLINIGKILSVMWMMAWAVMMFLGYVLFMVLVFALKFWYVTLLIVVMFLIFR